MENITEIAIELNNYCRQTCRFCYIGQQQKAKRQLLLTDVKKIIGEAEDFGAKLVRFTGGEPSEHPQLFSILEAAKKKNLRIILNTNAEKTLSKSQLSILQECLDVILISLQGCNKNSEEKLRGRPCQWKKKINNIYQINSSNIRIVSLGTIISKTVLSRWQAYMTLAKNLGIKNWWFYRPMLESTITYFSLTAEDYVGLIRRLFSCTTEKLSLLIGNALPFCIGSDIKKIASVVSGGYSESGTRLVYTPEGYFKPSYFIDINLGKTISRALAHPFIKKIQDRSSFPFCEGCVCFAQCHAGSRYHAKVVFDDYFAKDPLFNEKNSFLLKA